METAVEQGGEHRRNGVHDEAPAHGVGQWDPEGRRERRRKCARERTESAHRRGRDVGARVERGQVARGDLLGQERLLERQEHAERRPRSG